MFSINMDHSNKCDVADSYTSILFSVLVSFSSLFWFIAPINFVPTIYHHCICWLLRCPQVAKNQNKLVLVMEQNLPVKWDTMLSQ